MSIHDHHEPKLLEQIANGEITEPQAQVVREIRKLYENDPNYRGIAIGFLPKDGEIHYHGAELCARRAVERYSHFLYAIAA